MSDSRGPRQRVLWLSTIAFTLLFAVWLQLGVLGLELKKDTTLMMGEAASGLSTEQVKAAVQERFEWLLAVAILAGSIFRLSVGIWADRFGGRNMMVLLLVASAIPCYLLTHAATYGE